MIQQRDHHPTTSAASTAVTPASKLTDAQWAQYQRDGYLVLGQVVDDATLQGLQERIDAIMLGTATLNYDQLLMQLDSSSGDYGDLSQQSKGHKGATLAYRKIQDLEYDPLFLEYIQHPLFADICRRHYGEDTPVDINRAMFMNKPAGKGTFLPWHQDRWPRFDRDPQVTLWTALDPATVANGCVEVIPGSHHRLINPDHPSGFLTPAMAKELDADSNKIPIELAAGEVVLLHNWLLHSSQKNNSQQSRRALSVCYMDGRTQMVDPAATYRQNRIFPASEAFYQ